MIDRTLYDIFSCPVVASRTLQDETDFRGPNGNVNVFGDGDPVGADKIGNHGHSAGGNVMRKSGDVITVPADDELWILAGQKTCP